MERSKLADLSEIVSSIAIVVTLIYLTVEIRQNTSALNAQSRQAVLESAQTELFMLMDNPEITVAMTKTEFLSPEEQIRLDNFFTASLRAREFAWLQFQDGSIDESQWSTEFAVLLSILDTQLSRDWWDGLGRFVFSEEFGAYIDDLLLQHEATETIWTASSSWSKRQGVSASDSPE